MKIQILEFAQADLKEGYQFYENQEPGSGRYFILSLIADIEKLKLTGGIHRQSYRSFHRVIAKKFPFVIFYSVKNETVFIRSIVDGRRDPLWIRSHLKKMPDPTFPKIPPAPACHV